MKCTCLTSNGNTGVPNCVEVFDVSVKLIFVPYFNPDGSINGIDLSSLTNDQLDQTFLDSKIQALDPDQRWYPTPLLKNVVDERDDDIVETFEDSTSVFIQEGARSFLGLLVGQSPELKKQLDKWRCQKVGVYFIDKTGNLIGNQQREGFLDPVKLQDESLSIRLVKGTDTTKQKVEINFIVDPLMDDANLSYISSGNITADILGVTGLLDAISSNLTGQATTGFQVDLTTGYGGVLSKGKVLGLETADFSIFNRTQSAAVVITSVTENPDGTYTFVFGAQASADELEVGNKTSGTLDKGFDVNQFDVVIP